VGLFSDKNLESKKVHIEFKQMPRRGRQPVETPVSLAPEDFEFVSKPSLNMNARPNINCYDVENTAGFWISTVETKGFIQDQKEVDCIVGWQYSASSGQLLLWCQHFPR
jgi:hypothetical protein